MVTQWKYFAKSITIVVLLTLKSKIKQKQPEHPPPICFNLCMKAPGMSTLGSNWVKQECTSMLSCAWTGVGLDNPCESLPT